MSISIKFALFTSLLCLAIVGGISYYSYRLTYSEVEKSIGERLEAVVRSGAITVDGTAHDTIQGPGDAESEAFLTIRDHLRKLKDANGLEEELYTLRRVGEEMRFIVMSHEKPFIGDAYSIRREMLPTLNQGRAAHTGVYSDAHGDWISAYAPIFDRDGQISGLLEADMRVEAFLDILWRDYLAMLAVYAAFALAAVALSFLLARTVTRKLNRLTQATEKISLGKMDAPIDASGRDEVAKLAASLERMRESLRIAARMIE